MSQTSLRKTVTFTVTLLLGSCGFVDDPPTIGSLTQYEEVPTASPRIDKITPRVCRTIGGCRLRLEGANYYSLSQVTIGGKPAARYPGGVATDAMIDVLAPANSSLSAQSVEVKNTDRLKGIKPAYFYYYEDKLTLAPPRSPLEPPDARDMVHGDFNRDGNQDIAMIGGNGDLWVHLGQADRDTSYVGDPATKTKVASDPMSIASSDLNADSCPDLVIAHGPIAQQVTVLLGNCDGTFRLPSISAYNIDPSKLVIEDFDRDGILDIAAISEAYGTLTVLIGRKDAGGRPTGLFSYSSPWGYDSIRSLCYRPVDLKAADMNGDGKPDLILACQKISPTSPSGVLVLLNSQTPGAAPTRPFEVSSPSYISANAKLRRDGTDAQAIEPIQLDADGRADLIITERNRKDAIVLLNKPDGSLEEKAVYATVNAYDSIKVVDKNGDGVSDILLSGAQGDAASKIGMLYGRAGGTFEIISTIDVGMPHRGVYVADLDRDGWSDVVLRRAVPNVRPEGPNYASVLYGRRDGFEQNADHDQVGTTAMGVVSLDNGMVAILDASMNQIRVVSLEKRGSITPVDTVSLPVRGTYPVGLASADMDGDFSPDLITISQNGAAAGFVNVSFGVAGGSFPVTASFALPAGVKPVSLSVGDIDGGGAPDVVVLAEDGTVHVVQVKVVLGIRLLSQLGSFKPLLGADNSTLTTATLVKGKADFIVVANRKLNQIEQWYYGAVAPGTFSSRPSIPSNGKRPVKLLAMNADRDAAQQVDIVVVHAEPESPEGSNVSVFVGDGLGGLSLDEGRSFAACKPSVAKAASVSDINGDNVDDLTISCDDSLQHMEVWQGLEKGFFGALSTRIVRSSIAPSIFFDIDGDLKQEMVSVRWVGMSPTASKLSVLRNLTP